MRGMRRIGALGLRAGQLSSRSAPFARSRATSPTPSSSPSPSPSPSSSARQFLTAGIVGGALGVAVGVGVSGNGADTTGRRDVPGGRASRDSDERRIKRLRQRAIDQEQEQSTSSPVHSARDVPWYAEVVATSGEKILDAATLLQSDHPFLEDDHMFSAFLARGIINDIEGYYSKSERTFTAVVALGQDVSGYAGIVHGVYLDISTSRHLDISTSRCRCLDFATSIAISTDGRPSRLLAHSRSLALQGGLPLRSSMRCLAGCYFV